MKIWCMHATDARATNYNLGSCPPDAGLEGEIGTSLCPDSHKNARVTFNDSTRSTSQKAIPNTSTVVQMVVYKGTY